LEEKNDHIGFLEKRVQHNKRYSNNKQRRDSTYIYHVGYSDDYNKTTLNAISKTGVEIHLDMDTMGKKYTNKLYKRGGIYTEIGFSPTLANILGFKYDEIYPINSFGYLTPDINAGLYNLYVYCDIIKPQYLGHVKTKILRVVDISRLHTYCNKIYDKPYYRPLLINQISSIKINILDSVGQPVFFNDGKITLTLHFQEKNKGTRYKAI
jgi:hypothetical protein